MPHKHTPKVDRMEWRSANDRMQQTIDELMGEVSRLRARVDTLLPTEPVIVEEHRVGSSEVLSDMAGRLERLEQVYILVDFQSLEKAAQKILQGMPGADADSYSCDDLPAKGDSPARCTKQQGTAAACVEVPPCLERAFLHNLPLEARQQGKLAELSLKQYLRIGDCVERVGNGKVQLKDANGLTYDTASSVVKFLGFSNGVAVEDAATDPTRDTAGSRIRGVLVDPSLLFHICNKTNSEK